jgi:hypothetical protein
MWADPLEKLKSLLCRLAVVCGSPQDALNDAEDVKSVEVERNGVKFYDYEISSPVSPRAQSQAVRHLRHFAEQEPILVQ